MATSTNTKLLNRSSLLAVAAAVLVGCAPAPQDNVIPTAQSVSCPQSVAPWTPGTAYAVNQLVSFNGGIFRCLQAHTALSTWSPDVAPSLWASVQCGSGGNNPTPPPSTPPPSSPPPSTGCSGLAVSCPNNIPAWAAGISYSVGNLVSFDSKVYRCVQPHTSQADWTPAAVPALWEPVNCSTGGGSCTPTPPSAPPPSTPPPSTPPPTTPPPSTPPPSNPPPSNPGTGTAAGFIFSPYKDTSISMNFNTNVVSTNVTGSLTPLVSDLTATGAKTITLAFATGECGSTDNWGGVSDAQLAAANVGPLNKAGIKYILSTGGAGGVFSCGSDAGFATFINRWAGPGLVGVDFDIEAGQSPQIIQALVDRIKGAHGSFPNLRFSLTLATLANNNGAPTAQDLGGASPEHLNILGVETVSAVQSTFPGAWPSFITVNLMTMDFGAAGAGVCVDAGGVCQMGQSAIQAAFNLHGKHGVPFGNIELTPMIGGNDNQAEHFTLDDVKTVSQFAIAKGLAGVHYWSYDRDVDCPPGFASPTCNSLGNAGTHGFINAFHAAGLR
jgi:hypothetical protein